MHINIIIFQKSYIKSYKSVIKRSLVTHIFVRCGIALALNKLSQYLDESQVTPLFLFFVPDALNDRHTEVRRCMLDAALSALNTHGKVQISA